MSFEFFNHSLEHVHGVVVGVELVITVVEG